MGPAFRARVDLGELRATVRAVASDARRARVDLIGSSELLRAALRDARAAGATLGELAADAGLSRSRVAQIVNGEGER